MRTSVLASALILVAVACADDSLRTAPRQGPALGGITGRVCNKATGDWVVDATVTVGEHETTTDDNGVFTIEELEPGEHTVEVDGPDGYSSRRTVVVRSGEVTEIGTDICGVELGHIDGRVCNEVAEAWVTQADVSVALDEGELTTTTDDLGRFSVRDVPVGQRQVTVTAAGFTETYDIEVLAYDTVFAGDVSCGPMGSLHGRICGAEGYWLVAATVAVELPDGTVVSTETDGDGYFTLTDVPAGLINVVVTKGSFTTSFEVTVIGNDTLMLEEPVCIPPTTRIAVVTGTFDSVEDILTGLDFNIRARYYSGTEIIEDEDGNIDIIDGGSAFWLEDFLTDWAWLNEYQIIFFNCGLRDSGLLSPDEVAEAGIDNLRSFVEQGGSVYASDWASSVVMVSWPGHIDFLGEDGNVKAPRKGADDSSMLAQITDPALQAALGGTTATLNFDLSSWVVMDSLTLQPSSLRVMATSDEITVRQSMYGPTEGHPNAPLLVQFNAGNGRVLYTSFHNEAQTTSDMVDILNFVVFEL